MAENLKHTITAANSEVVSENKAGKHYSKSLYVTKKTAQARETLLKFPVPEKYYK